MRSFRRTVRVFSARISVTYCNSASKDSSPRHSAVSRRVSMITRMEVEQRMNEHWASEKEELFQNKTRPLLFCFHRHQSGARSESTSIYLSTPSSDTSPERLPRSSTFTCEAKIHEESSLDSDAARGNTCSRRPQPDLALTPEASTIKNPYDWFQPCGLLPGQPVRSCRYCHHTD